MTQRLAAVAGVACTAFALAWLGRPSSALPSHMSASGTLNAVRTADSVPCSGTGWHRRDDTAAATVLARLATQMMGLAESAHDFLTQLSNEGSDATPEFFTSAAEVARRAAAYGPDHVPSLLIASRATVRAATLGEGEVDTTLEKRAQCYAERALSIARRQGDQASAAQAGKLLEGIQGDLEQERHAAEVQRLRRP